MAIASSSSSSSSRAWPWRLPLLLLLLCLLGAAHGFVVRPAAVTAASGRKGTTAAARGRVWMAAPQLKLEEQQKLPDLSQVKSRFDRSINK